MQKRSKSSRLLNKMYMIVGKIVVFTGAFCGLFFALSNILSFFEPFILSATSFCMTNIRWFMIAVSIIVVAIWGTFRSIELADERRKMKTSDVKEIIK